MTPIAPKSRVSPSYSLEEFGQPPVLHRHLLGLSYPEDLVEPSLVHLCVVLERLRVEFPRQPVVVLHGYRCLAYQDATGWSCSNTGRPGTPRKEHAKGRAADILLPETSPDDVVLVLLRLAEAREIPLGGLGRHGLYTHIDVRPRPAGRMPLYWEEPGLPRLPLCDEDDTQCITCHLTPLWCSCGDGEST